MSKALLRAAPLLALILATACAPQDDPTQPDLAVVPDGKPQDIACRPSNLKATQKGKIKANDCLFGTDQREDLFRVDQLTLGLPDLSGAHMLTFTPETEFDGIFGVSNWDETRFGSPVYGFRTFWVDDQRTFSLIGSSEEYKLFMSGIDATQLGKYKLTTTVSASTNSCETGSQAFIQGTVAFSSSISDANSCAGQIAVGPNSGPINYQYWYAKLTEGQEVTVSIDGVDEDDDTIVLAVIVWGTNGPVFSRLDFSAEAGDTDRSITFTAPFTSRWYWIEVSSRPGVSSPYNLSFATN